MQRVLILVENLPSPFDRRVWQEATALRDAGYVVSIICPTGRGCEASFEAIDDIHIWRYELPTEGAGALVLESLEHAKARGAKILGVIEGCGDMADSFHRTRSSPDGKPIIGCVRNALSDAGIVAEQIDYINAHGTGTPENDKMEYLGISTVFGERTGQIPVSSNKSMVGHTLSAAGAVEAVFSLLTLEHQRIPPTINYDVPDPAIPFDVVPNKARDARVTAVMSNSFGFGGQNASLILTREPV